MSEWSSGDPCPVCGHTTVTALVVAVLEQQTNYTGVETVHEVWEAECASDDCGAVIVEDGEVVA